MTVNKSDIIELVSHENNLSLADVEYSIKKIIDYMVLAEDTIETNDQKELLLFKKGLYLIKNSKNLEGEKVLKDLIKKNSQLKFLAEEIIVK